MIKYGLKISKPNKEAPTAPVDDLILDSDFPIPKMVKFGAGTVVVSGGTGSTTIAHGQPTAPITLVYIENTAGDGKRYLRNYATLDNFYYTVDVTNLIVTAHNSPANGTYNFFYYIFVDLL